MIKLNLNYLTAGTAKMYSFYMIPKELIDNEIFDDIDYGSKILYGLMLSRASLSAKNPDFIDVDGNVYIIYTVDQVKIDLRCSNQTAIKMLKQLENIGLIERRIRGQGKVAITYVKDFNMIKSDTIVESLNSKKQNPRSMKNRIQGVQNLECNNNNSSNINYKKNNRIESNQSSKLKKTNNNAIDKIDLKQLISKNIELETLKTKYPDREKEILELYNLIIDTISLNKKTIRIAKEEISTDIIKSIFLKIRYTHIEYILESLMNNTTNVKNIKSYLLTSLYNSIKTIDNYYTLSTQHFLNNTIFDNT